VFWRAQFGKSKTTYLVTAAHVLVAVRASPEVLLASPNGTQVAMDPSWSMFAYSKTSELDLAVVEVPDPVWAKLGIKQIPVAPTPAKARIEVYGCVSGQWHVSYSYVKMSTEALRIRHQASTTEGWSGTPIMVNGRAIGIHTQSLGDGWNSGWSLNGLLRAVPSGLESDGPVFAWREITPDEQDTLDEYAQDTDGEIIDGRRPSRQVRVSFRDYDVNIQIGANGVYARHATNAIAATETMRRNGGWADYDDDDDTWMAGWEAACSNADVYEPVFHKESGDPKRSMKSTTLGVTSLRKESNFRQASVSDISEEPICTSSQVNPNLPPRPKPLKSSQNSASTVGPDLVVNERQSLLSTTRPSIKRDVSPQKERSGRSRGKSSKRTHMPNPRAGHTKSPRQVSTSTVWTGSSDNQIPPYLSW